MRERFDALFDRAQNLLADMAPRDRSLLLGLVIFFLVGMVGGTTWMMKRTLDGLQARVDDKASALEFVYEMTQQYANAEATLAVLEEDLAKSSGVDLSAFLEQAAQKSGIDSPDSVREKSTIQEGNLEEKIYTVNLNDVTLQQLSEFLYEAEASGYPLKIRSTKVKTKTKRDEKSLQVNLDISAYKAIAPGSEG